MRDIAACTNYDCPLREHCLRAKMDPAERGQTYAKFEFEKAGGGVLCKHFIPVTPHCTLRKPPLDNGV